MTDAYRNVKFKGKSGSEVEGKLLFDTGATTNLIAINHPILSNAELQPLPSKIKVNGAFNSTPVYITETVELDISAMDIKGNDFILGRKIKFYVIQNNCNFTAILGIRTIKELNISVGRKISVTRDNKVIEIKKNSDFKVFYNGVNDTGCLKAYFVDLKYNNSQVYLVTTQDNEYILRGNSFYAPKNHEIDLEKCHIEEVQKVFIEEAIEGVAEDFCQKVAECGQRELPKLDLEKIKMGEHLTLQQKQSVKQLLNEYESVFSKDPYDLGKVQGIKYDLETTSNIPQAAKIFPLPKEQQAIVHDEILKLLKSGVITEYPDCSIITSVFIPIKKKDGTYRLVSDFRAANNTIVASNLMIPKPTDLISKMSDHEYYCATDLVKAFWAVDLEESKQTLFTCFDPVTGKKFKYRKMPMGAKSASQAYHSIARQLLFRDIPTDNFAHYIDDATIFGNDFSKVFSTLRQFLENHKKFGFKINASKSEFFVREVKMLGFYVGANGIKMCDKKGEDFDKLEIPKTQDKLRKNLAGLGFYRTVVPDFAQVASPLYDRLKKGFKFVIDDNYKNEWKNMINQFQKRVTLSRPNFDYPLQLETDASGIAVGAVLKQVIDGVVKIIAVYSYKLSVTERHWECASRELLGIYKAIVNWKDYLWGRKFHIRTDSRVNTILLSAKLGQVRVDETAVSPAYKFLCYISKYDFTIEHISGKCKSFLLSDLLSRRNLDYNQKILQLGKNFRQPLLFLKDLVTGKLDKITEVGEKVNAISVKVPPNQSEVIQEICKAQVNSTQVQKILCDDNKKTKFTIKNGIVYMKGKLFVPNHFILPLLEKIHIHGQGTYGIFRQLEAYNLDFEGKINLVSKFILSCSDCQASMTGVRKKFTDKTISMIDNINKELHIDNMKFGNIPILVAIDAYSGFVRYKILNDETAKSVKYAIFDLFMEFGIPNVVKSDNGPCFISRETQELFDIFNCVHRTISPSNSRGNGKIEGVIGRIQTQLRLLQPDKNDINDLKMAMGLAVFEMNTKIGKNSKYSAFEIQFKVPSTYVRQMPSLSESKIKSLNVHMRNAYNKAESIKEDILKTKLLYLEKLEAANKNTTTVFHKGDVVKIRKIQGPGELKKLHRPFSNKNYEILKVLPHCNSLLLQEKIQSDRIRPLRLRIHMRYCKLVYDRELLKNQRDRIDFKDKNFTGNDNQDREPMEKYCQDREPVEKYWQDGGPVNQSFDSQKGRTHTSGKSQNSLIDDDDEKRLRSETKALFRKNSRLRQLKPINYKQ